MELQFSIIDKFTGKFYTEGGTWSIDQFDGMPFTKMSEAQFLIDLMGLSNAMVELTAVIE